MAILDQNVVAELITYAKMKTTTDQDPDVNIADFAGGNIDDAYSLGYEDGQTILAREILDSMGIEWK